MSQHHVTIEVANRRLKVTCPKGQESALLLAAEEVNQLIITDNKKSVSSKTPEQIMPSYLYLLSDDSIETTGQRINAQ